MMVVDFVFSFGDFTAGFSTYAYCLLIGFHVYKHLFPFEL